MWRNLSPSTTVIFHNWWRISLYITNVSKRRTGREWDALVYDRLDWTIDPHIRHQQSPGSGPLISGFRGWSDRQWSIASSNYIHQRLLAALLHHLWSTTQSFPRRHPVLKRLLLPGSSSASFLPQSNYNVHETKPCQIRHVFSMNVVSLLTSTSWRQNVEGSRREWRNWLHWGQNSELGHRNSWLAWFYGVDLTMSGYGRFEVSHNVGRSRSIVARWEYARENEVTAGAQRRTRTPKTSAIG